MQKITDEDLFNIFIEQNANTEDLFYDLDDYSDEIKEMLLRLYLCCYRFNLYNSQTKFMLNEALKPFSNKNIIDKEGLW